MLLTRKIQILRVNNVEQIQEVAIVEEASKRTARAALRHQKQTENMNKKIHAIGVIAKSVDERLERIANVDEREFDVLTKVIDGQVDLSKQAVELDTQWKTITDRQRIELQQLRDINDILRTAHQNKVSAINALYELADNNHVAYMEQQTSTEEQLKLINEKISAFDTKEYMSQITILVRELNNQFDKEKQAHKEQSEKNKARIAEVHTATKAMLVATGHYTKVMQTIDANVKHVVERIDLLDDKVSAVGPAFDNITESEIMELFKTFDDSEETQTEDTVEPIEAVSEGQDNADVPEEPKEDPVRHDEEKDDAPSETGLEARRTKHRAEDKPKPSKWKFWAK